MIKKSIIAAVFGIVLYSSALFSFAQPFEVANMNLILNNSKIELDNPIIVSEGRSYIALREAVEKFPTNRKVGITWDGETQTVSLSISGTSESSTEKNTIKLTVGDKNINMNGFPFPMKDALVLYNGRTYFPIRSITAVLGFDVSWDGEHSLIKLTSPKEFK